MFRPGTYVLFEIDGEPLPFIYESTDTDTMFATEGMLDFRPDSVLIVQETIVQSQSGVRDTIPTQAITEWATDGEVVWIEWEGGFSDTLDHDDGVVTLEPNGMAWTYRREGG